MRNLLILFVSLGFVNCAYSAPVPKGQEGKSSASSKEEAYDPAPQDESESESKSKSEPKKKSSP